MPVLTANVWLHRALGGLWQHLGRPLAAIGAGLSGSLPPMDPAPVLEGAARAAAAARGRSG